MATLDPNNFAQTENNDLTKIADAERKKLKTRNDYQETIDEYSVVHPDALADGDELGRGTGVFLDVFNENGGTSLDIVERKLVIKFNKYNKNKIYPDF